ncbi:MAG: hypothetical protein RIS68_566 [Bacteroidota bacterium]
MRAFVDWLHEIFMKINGNKIYCGIIALGIQNHLTHKGMFQKKLFIALVAMATFASCTKEESLNPTANISGVDVPSAVSSAVAKAYPNASIDFSVIAPNSLYAADITTATKEVQAVVSTKGEIREAFTKIEAKDLPAAITTYLETNYKGYQFVHASQKTTGTPTGYRVEIIFNKEFTSLIFDDKGAFVSKMVGNPGFGPGPGMGGKGAPAPTFTALALADLPAPVQAAIKAYTFQRAIAMVAPDKSTIYHIHAVKDGLTWDLDIDATGKILSAKEMKPMPTITETDITTLPAAIKTYLDANAPAGWTLKKATAISSDNVIIHYHVLVNSGTKVLTYMFDKDFKAITNAGKGPMDNPSLPKASITEISKDQIPATATSYLTANYAGYVFSKAISVSLDGAVKEIEVFISVGDKKYKVEFDATGKFQSAVLL